MNLTWTAFLYLSLHLLGFLFCMVTVLGVPGHLEETNPKVRSASKYFGFFLSLAWTGIPVAFIGSILSFAFDWSLLWKIFPVISLGLGLSAFFSLVRLYRIK